MLALSYSLRRSLTLFEAPLQHSVKKVHKTACTPNVIKKNEKEKEKTKNQFL